MPRIPDKFSRSVAFLYRSVTEAENNVKRGGTCFFVGKPIDGFPADDGGTAYFAYAVTNFHVAWTVGAPVIRLNRRDGRKHVVSLRKEDWIPHPDGDDLAVAFLSDRLGQGIDRSLDRAIDQISFVETRRLLTEENMRKSS